MGSALGLSKSISKRLGHVWLVALPPNDTGNIVAAHHAAMNERPAVKRALEMME